jgi:hypothetical protein
VSRPHVELVHAPELPWTGLPASGWPAGAEVRLLSRDAETGALSAVLRLPAGWRRPAGHLVSDADLLVLSGSVRIGDHVRGLGWYEYTPPGATQEPWTVGEECELFFAPRTGTPDFVAGPGGPASDDVSLAIDTETVPWMLTPIPGPPAGLTLKILRRTPEGGTLWLSSTVRDFDYPKIEYHDCAEESFNLYGDIWLGNSGTMVPGSYFWRPPYIAHGPFYSREGRVAITYCDGPLVNHFVDDPRRTPEENRAEAEAQGPPADYIGEALASR